MEKDKEIREIKSEIIKLVAEHKQDIFGFCCRMLRDQEKANEVAEIVFEKYFAHRLRQENKGKFQEVQNMRAYLRKIAYYECCRIIKDEGNFVDDDQLESFPDPASKVDPERHYIMKEKEEIEKYLIKKVQKILDSLNLKDRAVFIMRHYQNVKYKDIAKVLGLTENAVKLRFRRGLKTIRKRMSPKDEDLFYEVF